MRLIKSLLQIWENAVIAFNSLVANRMRALLSILGITIGSATIIMILTVIKGLDTSFISQISSLGSDNLHVSKIPWGAGLEFFKYRNRKDISPRELEAIKEKAETVKYVTPMVTTVGSVKYNGETLNNVGINGTDNQYKDVYDVYPEQGRFITQYEARHRRNVCVLGYEVAEKLFPQQNPLDKRLYVDNYPFRVIGVLEKQGSGLGGNLDTHIFIPLGAYQKRYGLRRSIIIAAKVDDVEKIDETADEIRGILRRTRKVLPGKDDDFSINQQDVLVQLYDNLTGGLFAVAITIGIITLLVGGIGIMNIMLVAVKERTREIGIRKAVGAKKKDLVWQFLLEALMVSAVGGILGIGLGFGSAKVIAAVSPLPAYVSPLTFVLGVAFTSAIGIFFGLYPAVKAAELNAIDGLRYE